METNMAINKITEKCKKARIASLILFCICIAAGAALIVSAVKAFPNVVTSINETDGSITVHTKALSLSRCVSGLVLCVLYGAGLMICSNMFAGISENGTPFRSGTADALKKISVIMLFSSILPGFLGGLTDIIICKAANSGESLRVIAANSMTVGIVPLFLAVFLLVMTEIFRYGCLLQQESDETL
ncbi:MAG: DUF2975 domain-containing protein [Ruminococcus sp.]|nr:DUF2975 domain-containing protein [Ruminococcus sp.]